MSWEQVYEQWVHEENLEENLKKQLIDLGEDPEKLEDAFYAPLEFGTAGMRGNLRTWDQSNEHLYGKTSNRRTCTFHGYTR